MFDKRNFYIVNIFTSIIFFILGIGLIFGSITINQNLILSAGFIYYSIISTVYTIKHFKEIKNEKENNSTI